MGRKLEQTLAVLNGLIGDHLHERGNGLATVMTCYRSGQEVRLDAAGIARACPEPTARVVVLVHGVMCTERVWAFEDGSDYGSLLERDRGYTAFPLRYNSGLSIADSGAELAGLLQRLVCAYPLEIDELLLLGYSMGGLVIRRACHVAAAEKLDWLELVERAIYVGTPHLGTPAERLGRGVARILRGTGDPYARLVGEIADLRSAGLKELGDADLRPSDHRRKRRARPVRDARHPLPLLPSIAHHVIAGSVAKDPRLSVLFGDALVPVASATFASDAVTRELLPERRVKVLAGLSHRALARHPDVYAQIRDWCAREPR